jgi:hypothetical protein
MPECLLAAVSEGAGGGFEGCSEQISTVAP